MSPRAAASRSRVIFIASIALAAVSAAPASAQLRAGFAAHTLLRPAGLLAADPSHAGAASDTRWADQTGATASAASAIQLDEPRDAGTGQYTRPKLAVGLPSDAMKFWLNSTGLATETCLLPMLRARTRVANDGELNGTLWLMARCTFR
jgi:hypothetical protein